VHSFASSSRHPQFNFRRKTTSTASIQPDRDSSDDESDSNTTFDATNAPASIESPTQCTDVYMSVHISHEKVGCAVYDLKSGRISLLEDCLIDSTSARKVQRHSNSKDEDDEPNRKPDSAMEEDTPGLTQSSDVIASSRYTKEVTVLKSS
jgi:hypothetical protein